jgi:hypothetical protein
MRIESVLQSNVTKVLLIVILIVLAQTKGRERLTCRTTPEFANLRGRETVNGLVSATKSARSIEASPR